MGLSYWEETEDINYDVYCSEIKERYYKVILSDLSLLQTYISLGKNNTNDSYKYNDSNCLYSIGSDHFKARMNNIFYSKCLYHNAGDYPVRINEKSKTCTCFGCGKDFSIITLVKDYFLIGYKDALDILYAYLYNDLDVLNKKQLEVYKEFVELYNKDENKLLKEKYLEESRQKTENFEIRITRYIDNHINFSNLEERASRRLSCKRERVKKYIPESYIPIYEKELPFK